MCRAVCKVLLLCRKDVFLCDVIPYGLREGRVCFRHNAVLFANADLFVVYRQDVSSASFQDLWHVSFLYQENIREPCWKIQHRPAPKLNVCWSDQHALHSCVLVLVYAVFPSRGITGCIKNTEAMSTFGAIPANICQSCVLYCRVVHWEHSTAQYQQNQGAEKAHTHRDTHTRTHTHTRFYISRAEEEQVNSFTFLSQHHREFVMVLTYANL